MSFYVTPETGGGGGGGASTWSEITGKPTFATVSLTGAFSDLVTKPAVTQTGSGVEVVDLRIVDGSEYLNWSFSDDAPVGSRGTLQVDHVFGRSFIAREEGGGSMTGIVVGKTNIADGFMGTGDVTAGANEISLFTAGDVRIKTSNIQTEITGPLSVGNDLTVVDDIFAGGEVSANDFKVLNQLCVGHSSPESAVHIRGARDVSGSAGIYMGTDGDGGYGIELVSGDGTGLHGLFVGTSGDNYKGRIEYNLNNDQWEVSTREFSHIMNWSNAALLMNRTVRIATNTGIEFQGPTNVNIRDFEESLTDASNALPTSYAVKNYVDKKTGTFSFYTSSDRLDSSGIGMTWNGYLGSAVEGSFNHQSEWSYDVDYVTTNGVLVPHVYDTNCPCIQLADGAWAGRYRVDFDVFAVAMEQSKCSLIPFAYKNGYVNPDSLPLNSDGTLKLGSDRLYCKLETDSLKIDGARSGSFHGVIDLDTSGDVFMISCMLADETTAGRNFEDFYAHNRQVSKFDIQSRLTFTYLG